MSVLWPCLFLATCSAALPRGLNAVSCTNFKIDVPVNNVSTIVPWLPPIEDQYQATSYADTPTFQQLMEQEKNTTTISRSYSIAGKWCAPFQQSQEVATLQILTHGIGFDQSYWDFYLPDGDDSRYSYVHAAAKAGYTTLLYNRLGTAPSEIADPYAEIQANIELALLTSLTKIVRQGRLPGLPRPRKIVHIGHSYGSALVAALGATNPKLSDGIILTGLTANSNYTKNLAAISAFNLANENEPDRFPPSIYSNGFITWPNKQANQFAFLHYPDFDPAALEYAEATKQPYTFGQLLTMSMLPQTAPNYHGSVLLVAGERDKLVCDGNCIGLLGSDSATVKAFNGSSSIEVYVHPNVGHGINIAQNATGVYDVMLDWIASHL
jgi:pimeloyl-ACP methyl ester carboxylesterase